jgi:hypothetical protein
MSRPSKLWPEANVFECSICDTECSNLIVDDANEKPYYIGFFIDQREGGASSTSYLNKYSVQELIKTLQRMEAKMP